MDDKKELYQDKSTMLLIEGSESTKTPHSSGLNLKRDKYSLLKQNDSRSNTRNQSAVGSSVSNMIANIFEDFFIDTNDLFN